MKRLLILLLVATSFAVAKDRVWQNAAVAKMTTETSGTSAVVIPVGNMLAAVSANNQRSHYWITAEKMTYEIHNYSEGPWSNPWLLLTINAPVKISVEGRNLYLIDTEGKERRCKIIQQIAQ